MATALSKKADEISMSLDKCLVNTEVAYEPPFDMNDSFEVILSDFIEKGHGCLTLTPHLPVWWAWQNG